MWRKWLTGGIVAFILLRMLTIGMFNLGLHFDERDYIGRSRLWNEYKHINLNDKVWESIEIYDQPNLPSFLYGMWFNDNNFEHNLQKIGWYDHQGYRSYFEMLQKESGKSIFDLQPKHGNNFYKILLKARFLSWLFSALTILIVFFLGKKILGFRLGLIWVIILGFQKTYINSTLPATSDAFLIFFLVLFAYLILIWVSNLSSLKKRNKIGYLVPLAIVGGLAFATKLNGGVTLIAFVACLLYLKLKAKKISWAGLMLNMSVFGLIFWAVFVALNPFVWDNPLGRTTEMIKHRQNTIAGQQARHPDSAINQNRIGFLLGNLTMGKYRPIQFLQGELNLILIVLGMWSLIRRFRATPKGLDPVGNYFCFDPSGLATVLSADDTFYQFLGGNGGGRDSATGWLLYQKIVAE